jgi:putative transposase
LPECGKIVQQCWLEIPHYFPHVELDAFAIMPNHVHGIIIVTNNIGTTVDTNVGANNYSPLQKNYPPQQLTNPNKFRSPSKTMGSVGRGFKIGVTKWFRNNTDIHNVWHRNYYERIIRSETELNHIREYITTNPLNWKTDENYTE